MDVKTLNSHIDRLTAAGTLPAQPVVTETLEGRSHTLAALVVDLANAIDSAQDAQTPGLNIFCDTLIVSRRTGLRGAVRRATIVARKVVSVDGVDILISHSKANESNALRLICSEIEGDLQIFSDHPPGRHSYDLHAVTEPRSIPQYTNFVFRNGAATTRTTAVPPVSYTHLTLPTILLV